jgi:2-polyprenyl-6-methoxyphenol hydroxylase-like FAD-dependent oxidoreductase
LVGAYLLAGELGSAPAELSSEHIEHALAGYEARMRPYVERCQDLPAGIDGYAPKSSFDIAVTTQVMKWIQYWPLRPLAARKWFTTAESIALPDYS